MLIHIRHQETSQSEGISHAHTTVRERSPITLEGTVIIGIVEIDGKVVLEAEHDTPQRVARTAALCYAHTTRTQLRCTHLHRIQGITRTAVHDVIVVAGEVG